MKRLVKIGLVVAGLLVAAVAVAAPLSASGILPNNLGRGLWIFQVRTGDTTTNTKIADFQLAAGTSKASIDIEGDIACHDVTPTGAVTVTGLSSLNGGIAVDSTFTVSGTTGATVCASTVQSTGNFSVGGAFGASKAEITATSGNIQTDGTLVVDSTSTLTGDVAIGANKFNVTATTGATVIDGSLTQGAAITNTTLAVVKGVMTWTSGAVNVAEITAHLQVNTDIALTGVAAGDAVLLVGTSVAIDAGTLCVPIAGADKIVLQCGNNSAGNIDPAEKTYSFLILDLT